MALLGTLASLSQTAASNAADGAVDAPSTVDQQINLLASYCAQLRDGNGFSTGVGISGDCRLSVSAGNIIMSPYRGNGLTINGVVQKIPASSVGLAPTALTPGVTYFIYAAMSGSTMILEASTTGHTTDSSTGVEVKVGDGTRTLVGMARPTTGPTFTDSATQRLVINWFNRRRRVAYRISSSALATASTSPVPLLSLEFLSWGDESFPFVTNGSQSNSNINALNSISMGVNSTSVASFAASQWQAYAASANGPAAASFPLDASSEGYYAVHALGWVSAGTGTWASPNGFEFGGVVSA